MFSIRKYGTIFTSNYCKKTVNSCIKGLVMYWNIIYKYILTWDVFLFISACKGNR